jgi:hypothetical protein
LELLYASIVSAISNVVDFMVCTSEFVGITLGFAALLAKNLTEENEVNGGAKLF